MLKSNNSQILDSKRSDKKMGNEDITKDEKEKLEARLTAIEDEREEEKEVAKKAKKAAAKRAAETEDNHESDMLETAADDDDEEKITARKKAKKAKARKAAEDEEQSEKQKEQTAKIATLTKIVNMPIIDKYLAARKMIGDDDEKLQLTKTAMLKASVEDNQARLDEIQPFLAQISFNTEAEQKSASTKFPMGLSADSQFSGSKKSAEEMFEELYQ